MGRFAARHVGLIVGPIVGLLAWSHAAGAGLDAQAVPQPFPRPSGGGDKSAPVQPSQPAGTPQTSAPASVGAPSESTLGVPVYPGATFIASYNAGLGQRYYLFGSTASFADLVAYYRNALKTRGELVFEEPATHMFDVGRFREESMAFPPSVTIKDYLWGGTGGYLNPNPAAQPRRFPTIIQIVAAPAATR
jgi:hypothetical protein